MSIVAVVGAISAGTSLIKSSAAGPNRDAAAQTITEAMSGNLAAVQAFASRSGIQTVSSAQPWQAGLQQIRSAHADWVDLARDAAAGGKFPADWVSFQPPQVYPATQQYKWTVDQQKKAAAGGGPVASSPAGSTLTNGQALTAIGQGAAGNLWVILGLSAVALGTVVYFARRR